MMNAKRFLSVAAFMALVTVSGAQELAMVDHRADRVTEAAGAVNLAPEAVQSPAFTFSVYGEIPVAKMAFEEEHYLGDAITTKWNTFLANYTRTYEVEVGFTNSGTELRKPAVYKAVERANKYVKKALKGGQLSREEAVATMAHLLDCANVICFEPDTEAFEDAAKAAKTGQQVVELFNAVKLENI